MSTIYKPLDPKLLNKPAGQCAFQLEGTTSLVPFGHATVSFKTSATKSEVRTPEDPGRPIIATDYSELAGMVDVEFGTLNTLGLALGFMANVKPFTQEAVPAKVQTFKNVRVNQWLELKGGTDADADVQAAMEVSHPGLVNTVVTAVTVGGDVIGAAMFRNDSKGGAVQVTMWPEGGSVEEDVTVAFSAPQVLGTSGKQVAELLQLLSLRGRFVLRQNNLRGQDRKIVIPKLVFGGDGGSDIQLIQDGNDVVKVKVSGTIEADYSQPPGLESGYMVDLG